MNTALPTMHHEVITRRFRVFFQNSRERWSSRRFLGAAVFVIAVWIGTLESFGVILYRTDDPSENITEPTGELAGSGWQFEGRFGAFLGTPIAPHYFITAKHIAQASSSIEFQGGSYTLVKGFNDPNSDLAIWQVIETFPAMAPLYTRADEGGKALVVIGRGTQRGGEISVNSMLKGWAWGGGDGWQRWGENTVARIVALGTGRNDALYATFDAGGGFNEAHLSVGDSGGAVFIRDANEVWKLAGINYAVDDFYADAHGNGGFNAALFDSRGFYVPNPSPPPTYVLSGGTGAVPSGFYATRISSKLPWIFSVIDPLGDVNGDGVNNLLSYALGIDPDDAEAGKIPAVEVSGSDLSLIYTKETTATDITYAIEQCADLVSWTPAFPASEVVTNVGTIQTIKAKVSRGAEPRLFLRLRVSRL